MKEMSHLKTILTSIGIDSNTIDNKGNLQDFSLLLSILQDENNNKQHLLGKSIDDYGEISSFLSLSSTLTSNDMVSLNTMLSNKSYFLQNTVTIADYSIYASVVLDSKLLAVVTSLKHTYISRWFNHIQNLAKLASPSSVQLVEMPTINVTFPLTYKLLASPTPVVAKAEGTKAESKGNKKDVAAPPATTTTSPAPTTPATHVAVKVEQDADLDPSKLDFRVGVILKCWQHPEAEKLLCEEIDLGESTGPRMIASGIRAHYAPEAIVGRKVLVLANLKERALVGFKSQGMVICACNDDHSIVKLLDIPDSAIAGDRVTFPGFESGEAAPAAQVGKKKILEKLAPGLRTDENGRVLWTTLPFKLGEAFITAPLPNAQVS